MPGGGNNNPTGKGGFKRQSGNLYRGRRSKEVVEITLLARQQAPAAIKRLAEIMIDPTSPKAAQVAAAQALLDRGCGKPAQSIEGHITQAIDPTQVSDAELLRFITQAGVARAPAAEPVAQPKPKLDPTLN